MRYCGSKWVDTHGRAIARAKCTECGGTVGRLEHMSEYGDLSRYR